jgi:3'(2'), 5'-bisphosphate nucleotidase
MEINLQQLLHIAVLASIKAGKRIAEIYETEFEVIIKQDYTPVTIADKEANKIIEDELLITKIPVLGEEGEHYSYAIRKNWDLLWIVDPLDGTKEFVKRNGEFTVNIGLSNNGVTILGVIFSPVFKDIYFAADGIGAFKINRHVYMNNQEAICNAQTIDEMIQFADKLPLQKLPETYTIVASRSHHNPELKKYMKQLELNQSVNSIYSGSSIKMCWVAEGLAHEYPRFGRTMEWDTCAGHSILKNAGGTIIDTLKYLPIAYNKENIENPSFIAKLIK